MEKVLCFFNYAPNKVGQKPCLYKWCMSDFYNRRNDVAQNDHSQCNRYYQKMPNIALYRKN